MLTKIRAVTLLGFLIALSACDSTTTRDPTAPESESGTLQAAPLAASNTWTTKSPIPAARFFAVAGAINNIIYVVGGKDASSITTSTVRAYNTMTDAWSTRASLPRHRASANGASAIAGRLYVSGGINNSRVTASTLYMYNPTTNTWVQKASLPHPGACGAQGVIGGLLYVYAAGNSFYCSSVRGFYRYNPATNSWTVLPNPPNNHERPVAGVIGGKLYLVGTTADHSNAVAVRALSVYTPSTNSWATKAPLPASQEYGAGAALLGKLYIAGGTFLDGFSYRVTGALRAYDPATNTWTTKASMPTPRESAAGINAGGLLWIISGRSSFDKSTKVEAYTP